MNEIIGNLMHKMDDFEAVVVTTNCVIKKDKKLVMGAGIALQFAEHFQFRDWLPETLAELVQKNGRQTELVKNKKWQLTPYYIIAIPTKDHFKNPSVMEDVLFYCEQAARLADQNQIKTILSPRPGCGMGGLDWGKLKPQLAKIWDNRFTIITPKERY